MERAERDRCRSAAYPHIIPPLSSSCPCESLGFLPLAHATRSHVLRSFFFLCLACEMGLLSTFGAIFSQDTLDYRLTANTLRSSSPPNRRSLSSSRPLSGPSPSTESAQSRKIREESLPSRWRTPEFFVYYLVFATAVPMMFKIAMDVSQGVFVRVCVCACVRGWVGVCGGVYTCA